MSENKPHHNNKWMPAMYVAYFGILEKIANEHGYALCIHGSVARDFDLVAIPFDEKIKPHKQVIDAIRKAVGMKGIVDEIHNIVGHEPHGRTVYTIECGAGGYFDLSFTPTLEEAMQQVRNKVMKEAEVKKILKTVNNKAV